VFGNLEKRKHKQAKFKLGNQLRNEGVVVFPSGEFFLSVSLSLDFSPLAFTRRWRQTERATFVILQITLVLVGRLQMGKD